MKPKHFECDMLVTVLKNRLIVLTLFVCCITICTERRVPWLMQNLTSQDVNSSSTLTLECLAHGVPTPFITWYKDKIPITEGPGEDEQLFKFA